MLSFHIAGEQALGVKVLANDTRLRLLHALVKRPGLSVTALAATVGMKPQAVSNQLKRLVDKSILHNVRNGANIHYRIADPAALRVIQTLAELFCPPELGKHP